MSEKKPDVEPLAPAVCSSERRCACGNLMTMALIVDPAATECACCYMRRTGGIEQFCKREENPKEPVWIDIHQTGPRHWCWARVRDDGYIEELGGYSSRQEAQESAWRFYPGCRFRVLPLE